MRAKLLAIALIFSTVFCCVLAAAQGAASEYGKLLADLRGGNTQIDFLRLRMSWVTSPEREHAVNVSATQKVMFTAMQGKDYAGALKAAEAVLDGEYVNIEAHMVASMAAKQTGADDKADFHRAVVTGLLDSIRHSGDGKSAKTAWVVINTHEEYSMLRAFGLRPAGQALIHQDGHSYDQMKATEQDGTEQTFYFNVDIPMKEYR
jgi:hypothetical protein